MTTDQPGPGVGSTTGWPVPADVVRVLGAEVADVAGPTG